jgi:uncharacterized membrane protein
MEQPAFASNFFMFPNFIAMLLQWLLLAVTNPSALWHSITGSGAFIIFQAILAIALVVFFVGTVHAITRRNEIQKQMNKKTAIAIAKKATVRSDRWEIVLKHLNSENASEWRLAVIEADTFLEEALRRMGYSGTTLGDVLKKIDRTVLVSINDAWEAHKVRNMIAHKGSSFAFSKHEAKRVISLYEKVFKELEIL